MVQKLIWIILVGVIYFAENCHGNNISIQADDRGFGYEILEFQLANSLSSMSKELDKVKETYLEMSKIFMEKQNIVMEQLISTIANNTSQNKISQEFSSAANKQFKMMEQLLNSLVMIANNTNQNKIADELTQMKDLEKISIEKQSSLLQQLLKIANNTNEILDNAISKRIQEIHSCKSARSTGLYRLICDNCPPDTRAYCEMGSFGGGWIVVQQRLDGSVNFTRNWHEYRNGFGTVGESTEFWLGLELIHQLTNSGDYELAVELKDENGKYGYAIYSEFKIAGEKEKYRLSHLDQFHGTVKDSLNYHKGGNFSTFDQDNDAKSDYNCSLDFFSGGGWWSTRCYLNFLNGSYKKKNKSGFGIVWDGFTNAATFSRMMIRRK